MTAVLAIVAMAVIFVWGGSLLLRSLDRYNQNRRQNRDR